MKQRKYSGLLIFLLVSLCSIPASAQFDVSLSPLLVEVDIAPGAKKTFSLYLTNENMLNSVDLMAYAMDLRETPEGTYQVADRGESEFSCAEWMTIDDTSFTMGPRESRKIQVTLAAPRNVFGGRYGAVVFEVVPERAPTGEKLGSVRYHFRMPTFVEVTVKRFGGLLRKASISDFKVEPVSTGGLERKMGKEALRFSAAVKNEGNIHVKGKGTLIIRNKEGRTKRRVPLGSGRGIVLPGATLDFQSVLKKPPAGEYTARALISFGGMSPALAEIPFSVTRTKSGALGSFKASSFIALDIKPENLEMKVPARGFRAFTFSFKNEERDSIEIKAYVKDIEYDEEGTLVTLDSSETGRSCRQWITLEPKGLTVAPEKRGKAKLTLQAPPQGSGGYYACVVFDAVLKSTKEDAISTPFQIPVIISVPPDLRRSADIVKAEVVASAGRPATVAAIFRNKGNVHVKPRGKIVLSLLKEVKSTDDFIIVSKPEYEKLGEISFQEVEQYVLPGSIRTMQAGYAGALEAGKYLAEITVDYGGEEPAKLKKEFTIR